MEEDNEQVSKEELSARLRKKKKKNNHSCSCHNLHIIHVWRNFLATIMLQSIHETCSNYSRVDAVEDDWLGWVWFALTMINTNYERREPSKPSSHTKAASWNPLEMRQNPVNVVNLVVRVHIGQGCSKLGTLAMFYRVTLLSRICDV